MSDESSAHLYAVGAMAVGGTVLAVGLAMRALSKAEEKKTPFFKDENPTKETKLPFIGAVSNGPFATKEDWQAWRAKYFKPADIVMKSKEAMRLHEIAVAAPEWTLHESPGTDEARQAARKAARAAHNEVVTLSLKRYIEGQREADAISRKGLTDETPGKIVRALQAEQNNLTEDAYQYLDEMEEKHKQLERGIPYL